MSDDRLHGADHLVQVGARRTLRSDVFRLPIVDWGRPERHPSADTQQGPLLKLLDSQTAVMC